MNTVTISLSEYDNLRDWMRELKNNKNAVWTLQPDHHDWYKFIVYRSIDDDPIPSYIKEIENLKYDNRQLKHEIRVLKMKLNKKWWQIWK